MIEKDFKDNSKDILLNFIDNISVLDQPPSNNFLKYYNQYYKKEKFETHLSSKKIRGIKIIYINNTKLLN